MVLHAVLSVSPRLYVFAAPSPTVFCSLQLLPLQLLSIVHHVICPFNVVLFIVLHVPAYFLFSSMSSSPQQLAAAAFAATLYCMPQLIHVVQNVLCPFPGVFFVVVHVRLCF